MAKRKRTKYNEGGYRTIEASVAGLNLHFSPRSYNYSANTNTGNTRFGVQGRGANLPSSLHASGRIGGAEVQGSYNLQSKQPNVTVTKPLSRTSNVQVNYGGSRKLGGTGITAMYHKSFPFGK
tara:strand:+ start:61 stop:429 length:369 start_codon:yes stop_codon:yes gene_type:complete